MERKQGFFSALKEEVVRGLSPERSRAKSSARSASPMSRLLCRGRKAHYAAPLEPLIARSRSLRLAKALSPLKEGPDGTDREDSRMEGRWGQWMKRGQRSRTPSISCSAAYKCSDLRLLLGVFGAPLALVHVSTTYPFPHPSINDTPIVSS